jgi:hypothetical protein
MIIGMIKAHPTRNRMPRQATGHGRGRQGDGSTRRAIEKWWRAGCSAPSTSVIPIHAPGVVVQPSSWLFAGTGCGPAHGSRAWSATSTTVSAGRAAATLGRGAAALAGPLPRAQLRQHYLLHRPQRGRVFNAATSSWDLSAHPSVRQDPPFPNHRPGGADCHGEPTARVASGPAGQGHPSRSNLARWELAPSA